MAARIEFGMNDPRMNMFVIIDPILWLMILPWFPTSSADSMKLFPCNDASGSAPYQILFLICTWLHSVSCSTLSANSRCFALVSKYVLLRFFVLVSKNFVESVPVSTLENVRLVRDSCSVCVSKCVCEHCLVQPLHVPGFRSHSCLAKRNNSTYCAAPMK